jgi:hypothetical protein
MLPYRSIDFHVEVGLLQLEGAAVVLNLGVCAVLDVHGGLLALSLPYTRVPVRLWTVKRTVR